jgi:hypothetical protein
MESLSTGLYLRYLRYKAYVQSEFKREPSMDFARWLEASDRARDFRWTYARAAAAEHAEAV